jgi:hypothetical protein
MWVQALVVLEVLGVPDAGAGGQVSVDAGGTALTCLGGWLSET